MEYKPRITIKGQALVDFILEFLPEEPIGDKVILTNPTMEEDGMSVVTEENPNHSGP